MLTETIPLHHGSGEGVLGNHTQENFDLCSNGTNFLAGQDLIQNWSLTPVGAESELVFGATAS